MTAGEVLVKIRIVPSIQLVDGHLPDGVCAGWAILRVAVALVRHPASINKLLHFSQFRKQCF
jgi:hypothetical protein